ncbi:fatty acid cis/trans isomerase, partial [Pseudomonas syringae group genomosp. 7]|uniref:fatty acid cis/trans isomerase n=1 Tax=Pseudomonas syringae group genomosp. 7 TaxID=251699 RepID=UPI00376FF7E6
NRFSWAYCARPYLDRVFAQADQMLSRLSSRPAAALKVIDQLPDASILRMEGSNGKLLIYSMLRNRAHSNVALLLGESYRYIP